MTKALLTLTPSESKRLIAKAVAALPEVTSALKTGYVIIVRGTTTTYVAEEILNRPWPRKGFVAGYVGLAGLTRTPEKTRMESAVLYQGRETDLTIKKALDDFGADDVFIKGANAIDATGAAGAMLGSDWGGTTGMAMGALAARGSRIVIPVGLEKLVPSVAEAVGRLGNKTFEFAAADAVGMMPILGAKIITEIQAFETLFQVRAWHVGSGGVGGAEGSVSLVIEGERDEVNKAFDLATGIKGEPAYPDPVTG